MFRILIVLGWLLSKVPEPIMKGFCWCLGALFFRIPSKRRRLIYSNLHHAFPERSPEWLRRTVWRVCQRTAEMGMFTIVSPHFSNDRMLSILSVPDEVNRQMEAIIKKGDPIVGFGTHFSMIEAFGAWAGSAPFKIPESAIMYRPHKNPRVNELIINHRERFGFKQVSRREGLRTIGEVLRRNGVGAVLFDQNTRDSGSLIPFFGRVTSATELPGLLTKKYKATPVAIASYRTEFWRASIDISILECEHDPATLTLKSNEWLENRMRNSDDYLVDWLWSHNRWKVLFQAHERLGMKHKKKLVDFSKFPLRKTRFAIVISDISQAHGQLELFLAALKKSRPDAEITLISRNADNWRTENRTRVDISYDLPENLSEALGLAKALRDNYLDLVIVPESHPLTRKFAAKTRVPQRFGISLDGKKDNAFTDTWTPIDPYSWQMDPDWISFGKHFGLEVDE